MKLSLDSDAVAGALTRIAELTRRLEAIRKLVAEQAEDEGLWFDAEHAPEAYLQQELRKLHAAIEGEQLDFSLTAQARKDGTP